uniref:Uncharacterized protein n=1 Tax=Vibrio phage P018-4 TaxID=3229728 RepID=A0AB39AJC1_9CAUD
MGEFLEYSEYVFRYLQDQQVVDEQVSQILESGDYSDEEDWF